MMLRPDEVRRRLRAAGQRSGSNDGVCVSCGKATNWRSVNNRCRPCEMDDLRARPPIYIDKDVLMSAGSDSNTKSE